jgi:hypothetical protein
MRPSSSTTTRMIALAALLATGGAVGCGGNIDLGSDILWTARFEGGTLDEWTTAPGGAVQMPPSPGSIQVSSDHAHGGRYAAQLVIDAESGSGQQNAVLGRAGTDLPTAAYYSAWYYVPVTVQVSDFWVIFKLRRRSVADDSSTTGELFDVDLVNDAEGEMTLQVFDFRANAPAPLQVDGLIVPVGVWFQIEAFYRNASDSTGALTVWFNGQQIADLEGAATSSTSWAEWDIVSVGNNLMPAMATLFADDCAISQRRIGPDGRIAH